MLSPRVRAFWDVSLMRHCMVQKAEETTLIGSLAVITSTSTKFVILACCLLTASYETSSRRAFEYEFVNETRSGVTAHLWALGKNIN